MKDGYSLLIFHFNVGKAILLGNPHISHLSNLVEVKLDIKPTEKAHKIRGERVFAKDETHSFVPPSPRKPPMKTFRETSHSLKY